MTITFWGVRGSTPAPGAAFARYGGHTTCVAVAVETERGPLVLVLDAGTGMRPLGRSLAGGGAEVAVVLTHLHADHLLGFPFFAPLYEPACRVRVLDYAAADGPWSPLALFDGRHYPLQPGDLACELQRVRTDAPAFFRERGLDVRTHPVNHPGGALGYRIEHDGFAFVFIPDDELDPPARTVPHDEIVAFCRGADVLCHDAQYLPEEIGERRGWGHSSMDEAAELAVEAGARHLVLFHHDPDRTDDALDALEAHAQARLAPHGVACTAAAEGLVLRTDLDAPVPAPPTAAPTRAEGA